MKHEIAKVLMERFEADYVSVRDDSAAHAGHRGARQGGDSHFSVIVVSEKFEGLTLVKRHQAIYKELEGCFGLGLHALAITAKTPKERS